MSLIASGFSKSPPPSAFTFFFFFMRIPFNSQSTVHARAGSLYGGDLLFAQKYTFTRVRRRSFFLDFVVLRDLLAARTKRNLFSTGLCCHSSRRKVCFFFSKVWSLQSYPRYVPNFFEVIPVLQASSKGFFQKIVALSGRVA